MVITIDEYWSSIDNEFKTLREFNKYIENEREKLFYEDKEEQLCDKMDNIKINEDDLFWEFFLEEENFKKLLHFADENIHIINIYDFDNFIPNPEVNLNNIVNPTIFQKREGVIRSILYCALCYPDNTSFILRLKNAIRILYMSVLEYSNYCEKTDDLYFSDMNVTYIEHEMMGLLIE